MTHSLYRPLAGPDDHAEADWVVIARAARGINDTGATERLRRFMEMARSAGAVNWGHGRGGARPNQDWETILAKLADLATVTVVFDDVRKLGAFLDQTRASALDLSITVSGDMATLEALCTARGWTPHSGRQAVGVFGGQDRMPAATVLCVTAQCGHGLVAARLVEQAVARIRSGSQTPEEAAMEVSRPCVCGLINPTRTALLLRNLAGMPLI